MKWLSYRIFTAIGWRFVGEIPDIPKMVIIGAPHTSNWDFFLFLAALHRYRMKVRFLGKHTLFRWPFGYFFRKLGGIPVDRSRAGGVVAQVKQTFDDAQEMILVVAPEGTRRAAPRWKSGFVEIAAKSDVPVVFAGVDGPGRTLVIGPPHRVGADRTGFMDRVRAFFNDKDGINPQGKGPVRIGAENTIS
jgi:1-acyl-sn-glycerol-3-phosphate acyltransferase